LSDGLTAQNRDGLDTSSTCHNKEIIKSSISYTSKRVLIIRDMARNTVKDTGILMDFRSNASLVFKNFQPNLVKFDTSNILIAQTNWKVVVTTD
jgi:hypothetical protein